MAQNVNPTFVKTPQWGAAQLSTGTGTTVTTLINGAANGSKVTSVVATQTSTGSIALSLYYGNGGSLYYLSTVTLTANAGSTDSVASANLLANVPLPADSDGNGYVLLASSADSLQTGLASTLPTAGSVAQIAVTSADF